MPFGDVAGIGEDIGVDSVVARRRRVFSKGLRRIDFCQRFGVDGVQCCRRNAVVDQAGAEELLSGALARAVASRSASIWASSEP